MVDVGHCLSSPGRLHTNTVSSHSSGTFESSCRLCKIPAMAAVPERMSGEEADMSDGRPEPKTAKGAATRRRLIDAARAELIEREGLLEVDSVARRAAVSVGAIYRHFESRGGLVGAVVDDFYMRYRGEALEINPAPGKSFAQRERLRTELSVAFHYRDPLARVILSNLHLDATVAVQEAAHIDAMIELAARVMALGQRRDEIPKDRDPRFVGAMIIGGMRRVLGIALADDPPMRQRTAAKRLWLLNAAIMGVDPQ
jgi:AcrR family transcriptional regulator